MLLFAVSVAQPVDNQAARANKVFRIGYVRGDAEALVRPSVFHEMRDWLLAAPEVQRGMQREGISEIALLAADSHENLIQRMEAGEFDVVFCTARDFVIQNGPYEVIFQLRRPQDTFDPRGDRVFHRGVVFVNNRSPLFTGQLTSARLSEFFGSLDAMAVVGSAAGYDYPLLKIASLTSGTLPRRILFCDSSQEVVKSVINGVAGAGACDAGVIEQVLRENGLEKQQDKLVRVVLNTDPIPTDPVAINQAWLPAGSRFGREVRDALKKFFARPEPGLPRLENASSSRYADLRENIARFREMHR